MKRIRRPAAEARAHILAVAQRQLLEGGPSALRLKDIADQAGVSHPTILHHFGSREGLVAAVVTSALLQLDDELLSLLSEQTDLDPTMFLEKLAEVFAAGGNARLLAWLSLSGRGPQTPDGKVKEVVDAVHNKRLELLEPRGKAPSYADSVFISSLVTFAIVGEAIIGDDLRRKLGADQPGAREEFQRRLAALLQPHIACEIKS